MVRKDYSIITSCYKENLNLLKEYINHLIYIIKSSKLYKGEIILILESDEFKKKEKLEYEFYGSENLKILINKYDKGFSSCLNYGISCSESEYIVRIDPDDRFSDKKIDYQIQKMQENLSDISYTNIYINNKQTIKYPKNYKELFLKLSYGFNPVAHPTVIFRRKLFGIDPIYSNKFKYAEDLDLWLKAIMQGKRFLHINKSFTFYSINKTSKKTRSNAKYQIMIRLKYIKFIFKFLCALTSGLIINLIRFIIPIHHFSLNIFLNKIQRFFIKKNRKL